MPRLVQGRASRARCCTGTSARRRQLQPPAPTNPAPAARRLPPPAPPPAAGPPLQPGEVLDGWESILFHCDAVRRLLEELGSALYPPQDEGELRSSGAALLTSLELMLDECPEVGLGGGGGAAVLCLSAALRCAPPRVLGSRRAAAAEPQPLSARPCCLPSCSQLDRLGGAAEPHLAKLRDACARLTADASAFSICEAKA
jgi:hypothetical protein